LLLILALRNTGGQYALPILTFPGA
jgi:hypothetical protein